MRQIADRGLSKLIQTTPDTSGETDSAAAAVNVKAQSAVCLPVVSDSQKLIWVLSDQIDLQLDGTAELEKAFDRFPYQTEKQTAALAKRCSLHPDQVKVWFILQRLRYGISWDYKDIQEVQRKIRPSQGRKLMQNKVREGIEEDRGENKEKRKLYKCANEGMMTPEKGKGNKQTERKTTLGQSVEDIKLNEVEENIRSTQKKRKRVAVTDKMKKKRMKGVVEGAGEIRSAQDMRERQKLETTVSIRKKKRDKANTRLLSNQEWPAEKSFVVSDKPKDVVPLLLLQHQPRAFHVPPLSDTVTEMLKRSNIFPTPPVSSGFEERPEVGSVLEKEPPLHSTNHNIVVTDVGKLKELIETDVFVGSPLFTPQQDSQPVHPSPHPSQIRSSLKTHNQLLMMREAFSLCQYPDSETYSRLATVIGVSRHVLVQWFSDMRYYVKKGKPRWMTQDLHSQVQANIKYRQYQNGLAKVQPTEGIGNTSPKMASVKNESCGENESLKVSPECE